MGLTDELGFAHRPANAVQRALQKVASTRAGAWAFSKTITPLDRVLYRVTDGRMTAPQVLAGLPVIMVTTTGRRSSRPRTAPLVGIPIDGDLAVIGTNFGQRNTPGWVFNLEADPDARVGYRNREVGAVARPATDDERARVFRDAAVVYPGYDAYQERISGRPIRIFVLEPASRATDG
jgi:deazaflavin-dependent oxidoreductase (nitroreductase family)